jgi:formate dehydrogenase major subunit
MVLFDRMLKGKVKGGFIYGHNPAQSMPNTHKVRKALTQLDFLVVGEAPATETSSFWHQPGVDPKDVKTEVFLLPSLPRGEKDGTISNSGRWHKWHHKGYEPRANPSPWADGGRDHNAHPPACTPRKGGAFPEPIQKLDWYTPTTPTSSPERPTAGSPATAP